MANPMTMGDAASMARSVADTPSRASFVPEQREVTPQPTHELTEIELTPEPLAPGVDLMKAETAINEGLDVTDPVLNADLLPAAAIPAAQPVAFTLPDRFDPREWTLIKGNWLSTPEPMIVRTADATIAGSKDAPAAAPATIGGILRDGFGRGVRSGTGRFVRVRQFGRE